MEKKYNLSQIMTRAWKLRRSYNCRALSFAQCLKRAWDEAKTEYQNNLVPNKFEDGMTITVDGSTRTLKRWTKGGYDRVYINGGSRKGDGFVDIKNKRMFLNGNLTYQVKMAEKILAMAFKKNFKEDMDMANVISRNRAYGVSSKYEFGTWNHVVYRFDTDEQAQGWLHTEEYSFRERELMSKTAAIKLAGKKAVENAINATEAMAW